MLIGENWGYDVEGLSLLLDLVASAMPKGYRDGVDFLPL